MSVVASDIVIYGAAVMPDDDSTADIGGGISGGSEPLIRLAFNDIASAGNIQAVSSSSGDTTQEITVTGRNSAGELISEAIALNGNTPVAASTQTDWERLLKAVKDATCAGDVAVESATAVATGTAQAGAAASASAPASITLQSGQGSSAAIGMPIRITNNTPSGAQHQIRYIVAISSDVVYVNRDWDTVPSSSTTYRLSNGMVFGKSPDEEFQIRRPFYNVAADVGGGSARTFYEKVFVKNNHATLALTGATIAEQADPSGKIAFALEASLDGTDTGDNRVSAPDAGYTFNSTTKNVANSQSLSPGSAQGMWLQLSLAAGDAAAKSTWTPRVSGTTT